MTPTRLALAAATMMAFAATAQASTPAAQSPLTQAEVQAAQQAWCAALVEISRTHARDGEDAARALAARVIDQAYGYGHGPVLFKPTLTTAPQTFRTTRAGALAYFVGGDPAFPKDDGFALKGWTACEVDNAAMQIHGNVALTMGNVRITDDDGEVTTVDKTWSFLKDEAGAVRIVLHHSSLPFGGG